MSWFTHLECSVPCGAPPIDSRQRHHLCVCGAPLLARYDLAEARLWPRESLSGREPDMWRYSELLPLFEGEEPVALGEGFTPLVHARRLGASLGLDRFYIKDESLNPTQSFTARGQSAAVTRAKYLGATTIVLPSAGSGGTAAAAYAAAAGLACDVFMPKATVHVYMDECRLYGARVHLVDGDLADAEAQAALHARQPGWYDVSALREPYRIEGKKTMGYELAEQMAWRWPDWIVCSTGGGSSIVGLWKAFEELEAIGWVKPHRRPRIAAVRADTRAPKVFGEFLVERAIRESGGTAQTVPAPSMVEGMLQIGKQEGISAAPASGAALEGVRRLVAGGAIGPKDTVVLFNTGGALKSLDVLP